MDSSESGHEVDGQRQSQEETQLYSCNFLVLPLSQRADKTYFFTDCSSFSLMRRLRLPQALALGHHFWQEGFEVLPEGAEME